MTAKTDIFETLAERARQCEQLLADIDLIRPQTYEARITSQQAAELVNGTARLYELRFEALFDAYSEAVRDKVFFNYPIEECVMQWWGACDDLRCAAEGQERAVLDLDGFDNVLLGVRSMAAVRGARFRALFDAARPAAKAKAEAEAESAEAEDANAGDGAEKGVDQARGKTKAKAKAKAKAKIKRLA